MSAITGAWAEALKNEYKKPYYKKLYDTIVREYATKQIFPPKEDIFNAFSYTPLEKVKVVILGQDPYHNVGQAHGLAFSVRPGVEIPPSLIDIFKEIQEEYQRESKLPFPEPLPKDGYLKKWADQGVFLLNTVLTVEAHKAHSHKGIGWEEFTDAAICVLNKQDRPIVFLLWGRPAQEKKKLLNNPNHLVLTAPHPSPLSAYRGFFGCGHFLKANDFLKKNGLEPIDWRL